MSALTNTIFVTFGLPGAGKSYVARQFLDYGFFYHDGDDDLPEAMRTAIAASQPINDTMRDAFFAQIIASTARLMPDYPRVVIAQTFIKEKYRRQFLEAFPQARFVLVTADDAVRERRLAERPYMPLAPEYVRCMNGLFEPPHIPHDVLVNDVDGTAHIHGQLAVLLKG